MIKKIKIACVGNMNNNMFSLCRYLKFNGFDAYLILTSEFDHFKPQSDTFQEIDSNFVLESDLLRSDILYTDKRKIYRFFEQFSFVIASGYSVAYLNYCKVKIDIVIPYGSDLYDLPFYHEKPEYTDYFKVQRKALGKYQKSGIENASAVLFDYTNEDFENVIKKFSLKGVRYKLPCPFIYIHEFNPENKSYLLSKSKYESEILKIKSENEFVFFNHIRQSWKNPLDEWSNKGNDKIFRAFKSFLEKTNVAAGLIVFEYGTDVEDSKALVKELKIETNIYWFPVSSRRDILAILSFADMGIGEVGDFSWFSYGAVYEFLAMRIPVMHHRKDSIYINKVHSLYDMYSVNDEASILNSMLSAYHNKEERMKIAQKSHEWYIDQAINKPLQVIIQSINSKSYLKSLFFSKLKKINLELERIVFYFKLKAGNS